MKGRCDDNHAVSKVLDIEVTEAETGEDGVEVDVELPGDVDGAEDREGVGWWRGW